MDISIHANAPAPVYEQIVPQIHEAVIVAFVAKHAAAFTFRARSACGGNQPSTSSTIRRKMN